MSFIWSENQSDFRFIYESGKINLDKKVSVQVREQTVEVVIEQLFNNEGLIMRLRKTILFW